MPYFRHRSFVFAPASASLSTPMICSSVNRRLFIRLLPDEQTLLHSGTNLGEQTTMSIRLRRSRLVANSCCACGSKGRTGLRKGRFRLHSSLESGGGSALPPACRPEPKARPVPRGLMSALYNSMSYENIPVALPPGRTRFTGHQYHARKTPLETIKIPFTPTTYMMSIP